MYWPDNKLVSVERNVHFGATERLEGGQMDVHSSKTISESFPAAPPPPLPPTTSSSRAVPGFTKVTVSDRTESTALSHFLISG
jgi:hypothetical protein